MQIKNKRKNGRKPIFLKLIKKFLLKKIFYSNKINKKIKF